MRLWSRPQCDFSHQGVSCPHAASSAWVILSRSFARLYRGTPQRLLLAILLGLGSSPAIDVTQAGELVRITDDNFDDVVPAGKEVDAIVGDWVLRNDKVVVVIAQSEPWRHANLTIRNVGGTILDFTTRDASNDQLGIFSPLAGRYSYRSAPQERQTPDGTASLEFESTVASDGTMCRVVYSLADGDSFVSIQTIVTNPTSEPKEIPLRDSTRADRTFTDGIDAAGETTESPFFWIEDRWFPQAYGLVADGYEPVKVSGRGPIVDWSREGKTTATVAAGASFELSRRFYVASHRVALRGVATTSATVERSLTLLDRWGPVSDALVTLSRDGNVYGSGVTDSNGIVSGRVPLGNWHLKIESTGRPTRELDVLIDEAGEAELRLADCSRVNLRVVDDAGQAIAFKCAFVGVTPTSSPNFGPDSRAWACGNVVYSASGQAQADLLPGKYEVIISHGPEHDAVVQTIELTEGAEVTVNATLNHVVDTTGWVSTEYHSHSSPSGDNTSDQLGRVLNLLAENLEFAPCTEHARIDSYVPHLERLNAVGRLATCTGMELTGGPLPVNHQNAFPLIHRARRQNGGGPETDINPIVQIERLAMWDDGAEKLVQTNHPNLRQIYGDTNADGIADEGLKPMFGFMDVMEIHPPEGVFQTPSDDIKPDDRGPVAFHWMQLLNLGYRIPGVVNTDAHYNLHGSGWLRNYVRSSSDDPSQISVDEMVRNSEAGRIVMTSGPYLEVTARSGRAIAIAGEDLPALEKTVELTVRVQCPNWLDINRVQVFVNGRPSPEFGWTRREDADAFGNGVVKFERRITMTLEQDAHLIVGAIGEGLSLGRVMGDEFGKMPPVAVSNPIFVDIDGDGFQANGDELDHPLPVLAK